MVEIPDITTNNDAFFEAIRAQLSAASVRLERLTVEDPQAISDDPLVGASALAADQDADMVFWITEAETVYTIFFYTRHATTRQLKTREMDLASENPLSRSDTVGNAVSSFVEETFHAPGKKRSRVAAKPPTQQTPPPPKPSRTTNRKWAELSLAYAGSFFDHRAVTHGVRIGVGLLPTRYIALALGYVQSIPIAWETERYRLSLTSRTIAASIAARWIFDILELRMGLSWSVALRSYSMVSFSEAITPRPDDLTGVHSLGPFLSAIWSLTDRLGIVATLGVNLAVNEKVYLILRTDGSEAFVMEPFISKLGYQIGMIVQL